MNTSMLRRKVSSVTTLLVMAALAVSVISCESTGSRQAKWQDPPPVPMQEEELSPEQNATHPARDQAGNPRLDRIP